MTRSHVPDMVPVTIAPERSSCSPISYCVLSGSLTRRLTNIGAAVVVVVDVVVVVVVVVVVEVVVAGCTTLTSKEVSFVPARTLIW